MCIPRPTRLVMAVELLRRARIVGYPTESVFGLGCDPRSPDALAALIRAKARDRSKGLILIADDVERLRGYIVAIDPHGMQRVLATWPGPNTWVFPASPWVHPLISGGRRTVAVRVTDHPLARALCRKFGGAIVSTSANRAGGEPQRSAACTRRRFGAQVAMVLDGPLGSRRAPSTIRDARTGRVLRPGDADADQD